MEAPARRSTIGRMVVPSSLISLTFSTMVSMITGAAQGRLIQHQDLGSTRVPGQWPYLCSPPDMVPASWVLRSASLGKLAEPPPVPRQASTQLRVYEPTLRFLPPSNQEHQASLGHLGQTHFTISSGRFLEMSVEFIVPDLFFSGPEMA